MKFLVKKRKSDEEIKTTQLEWLLQRIKVSIRFDLKLATKLLLHDCKSSIDEFPGKHFME